MAETSMESCEHARLRWQCRRGMLELDYLLEAYLDRYFDQLAPQQQQLFVQLLATPDPVLQAWIMGGEGPENIQLQAMVDVIRVLRV